MFDFNKVITNNRTRYIFLLILTPVIWLAFINVKSIGQQWLKAPSYLSQNIGNMLSPEKSKYVEEVRWVDFVIYKNNFLGRFFYNKGTVLVDQTIGSLTFLSPRFYFLAGDGSNLSPRGVEPISLLLYPFWLIGVIALIRNRKFRPLVYSLLFSFIAFLIGHKSFYLLLPVALIYIYIANIGIGKIKNLRFRKIILITILFYSLYIFGRAIWGV